MWHAMYYQLESDPHQILTRARAGADKILRPRNTANKGDSIVAVLRRTLIIVFYC
jgi:hypothetical protein